MPVIQSVKGISPKFGENCFIAENATIIGDVVVSNDCSIWYNAVIRGDVCPIKIGEKTNIQDGAVIHGTFNKSETIIGNNVSIGHNAIVHGCIIEDNVLIGMGAIIMDNTRIPSNVVIGAGAVIAENKQLESGWIYAGVPAKKLKPLDDKTAQFFIHRTAENYAKYASWIDT